MIPYNTDAPLYHLPIATVGLIVLNTALYIAVPSAMVDFDSTASSGTVLSLEYGHGIKPWQWLTSIFMHANPLHLIFNMIALWAFGLVVEGKVGLMPFLGIYLGIGVVQSAIEQLLMCLYGVGGSLGASAAIFGILGVAIVWAPKNEFEVFYQFGFKMGTAEIPIMMYGFLQFALEVFNVVMGRFEVSAGVLHLMGFALGIAVGFVWLVRGWVDCEGWDLVTVIKGHEGRDFERERLEKEAADLVDSTHRPRPKRLFGSSDRRNRQSALPSRKIARPASPSQGKATEAGRSRHPPSSHDRCLPRRLRAQMTLPTCLRPRPF